jgi:hypothetical protein
MDDWSVSSPKNGVTEQGRRIGEYSALPADELTPRRVYMAPRQYRLKKRPRGIPSENVRTKKLKIFIIDIVDFKPHCWNLIRTHILIFTRPGLICTVQSTVTRNMVYRHKKLVSRTIEKPIPIDYLKILVTDCLQKDINWNTAYMVLVIGGNSGNCLIENTTQKYG